MRLPALLAANRVAAMLTASLLSLSRHAAMVLLGEMHRLNRPRLHRWAAQRQCALEGGFSGRANKLVDGCYSFWQGGLLALLMADLPHRTHVSVAAADMLGGAAEHSGLAGGCMSLFDVDALQRYILAACQDPSGGLRDKPSLRRDFYHTCYCLSGLSSAQARQAWVPYTTCASKRTVCRKKRRPPES